TADFGGDFWAADVAGKLFNRWCSYNDMAEAAGLKTKTNTLSAHRRKGFRRCIHQATSTRRRMAA
ncbi:hypothetical protein PZC41_14690, partial [Staphylococcus aureus]|uniref:hypothetical protein n=1 Tax=Staphylococcus aureus TaxID=1280 RepID=UPI0023AF8D4B